MANTSRSRSTTTSRKGAKKSTSSSRARSNSSRNTRSISVPVQEESRFVEIVKKLATSRAASPIIFIASVLVIVGIDLLVSWNKYELFFKILGIEVLIAVIIWVILTLVFSGKKNSTSDDE